MKSLTTAVRMDSKGRLTIPREVREELDAGEGTLFFLEQRGNVLQLAVAENPFATLATEAVEEHRAGRTRSLRDYAREASKDADK